MCSHGNKVRYLRDLSENNGQSLFLPSDRSAFDKHRLSTIMCKCTIRVLYIIVKTSNKDVFMLYTSIKMVDKSKV